MCSSSDNASPRRRFASAVCRRRVVTQSRYQSTAPWIQQGAVEGDHRHWTRRHRTSSRAALRIRHPEPTAQCSLRPVRMESDAPSDVQRSLYSVHPVMQPLEESTALPMVRGERGHALAVAKLASLALVRAVAKEAAEAVDMTDAERRTPAVSRSSMSSSSEAASAAADGGCSDWRFCMRRSGDVLLCGEGWEEEDWGVLMLGDAGIEGIGTSSGDKMTGCGVVSDAGM